MRILFLKLAAVTAILLTINCSNKDRSNSTNLQFYQELSYLMLAQLESEDHLLDIKVTTEDSSSFSKEIETLPKFVFFHSELDCNSCVEEDITLINDFSNDIGSKNIILLASYNNKRDLHLFRRINKINSFIYNTASVGLPIEELNLPFCFVINKNFKSECVFIPLKEDKSNFKRYLKIIKEKYFN